MPPALKSLVPRPAGKTVTIVSGLPDPEQDTVPFMIKRIKATLDQTKKLADKLKGNTLAQTLRNDSQFILNHILYRRDSENHEQVRDAARTIYDGKGDCDCFVQLLGGLLTNQNIKFYIVTTEYPHQDQPGWTHTYIIVPKNQNATSQPTARSEYFVLDPVTNRHDFEVTPIRKKKLYPMSLQSLQGISNGRLGACKTEQTEQSINNAIEEKSTEQILRLRKYSLTSDVVRAGLVPTKDFLKQKNIPFQEKINPDTNQGYLSVATANGDVSVPTVITKQDAAQLESMVAAPAQPEAQPETMEASVKQAGTGIWTAVGLALAALGSVKGTGAAGVPGLSGPPKRRVVRIGY